jgi:hypothetical protein
MVDMPVPLQIANAVATFVLAGFAVSISLLAWSDSHTVEQVEDTSNGAHIVVDRPVLVEADKGKDGNWSETVSGSGFNGDSLVYIFYPSDPPQPKPSGGQADQDYCPLQDMPILVNSGSFVAHVPISGKLPEQQDYIYVLGSASEKQFFASILVGNKPPPAPTSSPPAPTLSSGCVKQIFS